MLRMGLSEVAGFWKIIAIRRPRISAIRLSGCSSRFSPSNTTRPATMRAGGGARRSSARLATVLPLPDSPTMPKRLAGGDLEIDAIDGPHHAVARVEMHLEPFDRQQRRRLPRHRGRRVRRGDGD